MCIFFYFFKGILCFFNQKQIKDNFISTESLSHSQLRPLNTGKDLSTNIPEVLTFSSSSFWNSDDLFHRKQKKIFKFGSHRMPFFNLVGLLLLFFFALTRSITCYNSTKSNTLEKNDCIWQKKNLNSQSKKNSIWLKGY